MVTDELLAECQAAAEVAGWQGDVSKLVESIAPVIVQAALARARREALEEAADTLSDAARMMAAGVMFARNDRETERVKVECGAMMEAAAAIRALASQPAPPKET